MNKIEELPITIGLCTQLVELQANFNDLKVLPEATGNLTSLQKLSIHLNHVQRLPTTLPNLTNLVELDVRFNRLERIPDSLCYLPNLTILDVSSNFTELRELPKAIGDMPSIRELYISNNALSTLPASFAKLTGLVKLELIPNPWVLPPLAVAQRGKEVRFGVDLLDYDYLSCMYFSFDVLTLQSEFVLHCLAIFRLVTEGPGMQAVLQFMAELAEHEVKDEKEITRKPSFGSRMSSVFRKKKKSQSSPYVVKPVNPLNIRA